MHDRPVVVRSEVVAILDVLAKVELHRGVDIGPHDGYEAISIFAALLVPQAHGMTDLVDCVSRRAIGTERDVLLSTLSPDHRRAAAAGARRHGQTTPAA